MKGTYRERRIQSPGQGRHAGLDSGVVQPDFRPAARVQSCEVSRPIHQQKIHDRGLPRPDRRDRQLAGGHRIQHGRHLRDVNETSAGHGLHADEIRASTTAVRRARVREQPRLSRASGTSSTAARTTAYKRIAKGGREVWLQASYNPIPDLNGKPFKVVKYADRRHRADDAERGLRGPARRHQQVAGRDRVRHGRHGPEANDNFASDGLPRRGQGPARTACSSTPAAHSAAYRAFWAKLDRGDTEAGKFKRIAKGGREVWLQARTTRSPIRTASRSRS